MILLLLACTDPTHNPRDSGDGEVTVDEGPTSILGEEGADATWTPVLIDDDRLSDPRDLGFDTDGNLWVANRSDDRTFIVLNPGTDEQDVDRRKDGYAEHFMEETAAFSFEGIEGEANLPSAGRDGDGELARAEADVLELVQLHQCGRCIDGVHDVVERLGQFVDVFAIDGGDEGAIQAGDDVVGQEIALVLDLLDLLGLVPDRLVAGEHFLKEDGSALELVGQRLEVTVKLLFARNQTKCQRILPLTCRDDTCAAKRQNCSRFVYTPVTRPLHSGGVGK